MEFKGPGRWVGLLDEDDPAGGPLLQERDHLAERFPSRFFRGLDVDEFANDLEAVDTGVITEKLDLGGDRVALFLLLLRRDAGVDYGLLVLVRWA